MIIVIFMIMIIIIIIIILTLILPHEAKTSKLPVPFVVSTSEGVNLDVLTKFRYFSLCVGL